jgi:hypothetical protein
MRGGALIAVFVLVLVPMAVQAAQEAASPPVCRTAEINPVTGHTFCIDPRGAPVEAPPDDWIPSCEDGARQKQTGAADPWTYGPNCTKKPASG